MEIKWFLAYIFTLLITTYSQSQHRKFESQISIDSIIEKIDDLDKLNKYLNKIDSLDIDEDFRNSYDYSVFLFTVGLAFYSNNLNPLGYFNDSLEIIEKSDIDYFDEKSMNCFYIAKSNLIFLDNKSHYDKYIEKAYMLLKNVSETFPVRTKKLIQLNYANLLYEKEKYRDALALISLIEDDLFVKHFEYLLFLKADIFNELKRNKEELSVRKMIHSQSLGYSLYTSKFNESTKNYLTLLIKKEKYQAAKKILEKEFENLKLLNNDISKFELFTIIHENKDLLNLTKEHAYHLRKTLENNFTKLEGLNYKKYNSEVNSLIDRGLFFEALEVNAKHYEWYLSNDIKNAYLISILMKFDIIYKNIDDYNFRRKENIKLILSLIENDKILFDQMGVMGYEIPAIAQELGFKELSEKYFVDYLDSQITFFDNILRSDDDNKENWIDVLSKITNEILTINLEQNFIIDKYLIYWIELLNQFEYNNNSLSYETRDIYFSLEPNILESYDDQSIFFREYYDHKKNEFRVVIYYIGINDENYYLLSKEDYSVLSIWKNNKINKNILRNIFKKIKKTENIFIISSGIDSFMNFSVFQEDFELLNKRVIKIININSLKEIQTYKNIQFKSDWNIELFGDIDYDVANDRRKNNVESSILFNKWSYLPGTFDEIKIIAKLASKKNIKHNIYSGIKANFRTITNLSQNTKSFIIHIATHGFFLDEKPDDNLIYPSKLWKSDSKLDKSGIILSGGNKTWFSESLNPSNTDAILTSKEIENLDFKNCKLAIISSCNSGMADISTPNHIAGLQSAFKVAGVDKLILSIFEIPDDKAPIFFEYFYSELFRGLTIHTAFSNTQKEMRKRYGFEDDFWSSFILLE
jgi:hypothetical protein